MVCFQKIKPYILLFLYIAASLTTILGLHKALLFPLSGAIGMFISMLGMVYIKSDKRTLTSGIVIAIVIRILFIISSFDEKNIYLKFFITFFDVAIIFLLLSILRSQSVPKEFVFLYALNPMVIIMMSGNGCFISITTFVITFDLFANIMKQRRSLGCSFVNSMFVSVSKAFLSPFVFRALKIRSFFNVLLPLLLFLCSNQIVSILNMQHLITSNDAFDNIAFIVLHNFFALSTQLSTFLLYTIIFAGLVLVFLLTPSLLVACRQTLEILLLFWPVFYLSNIILMIPFVVLFRRWSWLTICLAALLYYLISNDVVSSNYCDYKQCMFYIWSLFFLLYCIELIFQLRRWPVSYSPVSSISIVIPTLNEELQIQKCIDSIKAQNIPAEIIVIDCGSTDRTMQIVSAISDIKLFHSTPGRGIQIAKGVEKSQGDTIVVLHADSELRKGALTRMLNALSKKPDAAGGSFGMTYNTRDFRLRFAVLLHNLKACYTGISFGDQAQFFRKAALQEGFPQLCLMEDVELSMRLLESGNVIYISDGVASSNRQWLKRSFGQYFGKILYMVGFYLLLRSLNLVKGNCEWFYRIYYRKKELIR